MLIYSEYLILIKRISYKRNYKLEKVLKYFYYIQKNLNSQTN